MGAPWHNVDDKVEDAFKGLIEALEGNELAGYTIYAGKSGTELTGNRIEVFCTRAAAEMAGESDVFTGNWYCDVEISLVGNYGDTTRAERSTASSALFDSILDHQNLSEQLNNLGGVADFRVYGGEEGQGQGLDVGEITNEPNGHEYVKKLTGTLYCRPS